MWREIWVDADIRQADAAVFYNLVQEHDYDAGIAAWGADFNDASNFLDLLRTGNSNNYGLYSNPEYDALLDEAENELDLEARGQLLARAEAIALADYAWVPEFFGVNTALVEPYVEGWVTNAIEKNRTRWVTINEAARAAKFPGKFGG
jgi:oligopeptide transport system substrate-binding protein